MAKSNEMKVFPYLKKWKWLAKFLDMEDRFQMMLDKEKDKEQAEKENSPEVEQAGGGGWAVEMKDDDRNDPVTHKYVVEKEQKRDRRSVKIDDKSPVVVEADSPQEEEVKAGGGGLAVDMKDDDRNDSVSVEIEQKRDRRSVKIDDKSPVVEADSPQEEEVKAVVRRNSIQVKYEISNLTRARAEIIKRLAKEKEVLQMEQDRKVETDARLVMVQGQLESAVKKRDAVLARYRADARKAMGLDDSDSDEE